MMDRCRYIRDGGTRILIPGCMGVAVCIGTGLTDKQALERCTCPARLSTEAEKRAMEAADRVKALCPKMSKAEREVWIRLVVYFLDPRPDAVPPF